MTTHSSSVPVDAADRSASTQQRFLPQLSARYLDLAPRFEKQREGAVCQRQSDSIKSRLQRMFRELDAVEDEYRAHEILHERDVQSKPLRHVSRKKLEAYRLQQSKKKEKKRARSKLEQANQQQQQQSLLSQLDREGALHSLGIGL